MVVALFKSYQKRKELEIQKTELEMEKIALEKAIIENSFIFCPNCGHKIKTSEMEIHYDKEVSK